MDISEFVFAAYCDGACEPTNPGGNMGLGALIYHIPTKKKVFEKSEYILKSPKNSNNVLEYMALQHILNWFIANNNHTEKIVVMGDSKLVICQMAGEWGINQGNYVPFAREAQKLAKNFPDIHFRWIPREKNYLADELSKREMIANNCEFRIQKNR